MERQELDKYLNKLVRVKYTRDFRPDEEHYVIVSFKQIDDKHKYVYLGHPYDLDKNYMFAGEIGINYEDDKFSIEPVNDDDLKLWLKEYKRFHDEVIEEKGYDFCEENLIDLEI